MTANPNAGAVFAAGPDRVTGAVLSAPKGAASVLPISITTVLDTDFIDNGYISEDGLSLTQDVSWEKIKEWGGNTIRRILSDFTGTFSWTFLETNDRTAKAVFGEANVTATAATATTGSLLKIIGNAEQAEPRSWVFRMKDGVRKIMIVVPDGQITDRGDISYTRTGAVTYPVTLEASPDSAGNSFYIYTDDGVFSA
jgi:hypothetical protein